VLDPARLRQDLLVLELPFGNLVAAVVEDHESSAGGALIQGTYEISHVVSPTNPLLRVCGYDG